MLGDVLGDHSPPVGVGEKNRGRTIGNLMAQHRPL
jgi:hypothetical protein